MSIHAMLKFRLPLWHSIITALLISKLSIVPKHTDFSPLKVLVHGCLEARCKPLIRVIQTSNRSLIFTQELAFFRNEGGFPFRGTCLLSNPRLLFAGLIDLHFELFSKFSLWSLRKINACLCAIFSTLSFTPSLVVICFISWLMLSSV